MQKSEGKNIRYENALERVKSEVDRMLSSSPPVIRGYTKHLSLSTGKFIRAVSVVACARDEDGLVPEKAIKLAAAIEILHLATLVHDDIIDNADLRRGQITLQKKYGQRTAVICGDYLVCMAMKLAASATEKTDLEERGEMDMPDYMGRICLGELNQHINNGNIDLTVRQYLKIISGKTAALFEASFYTGAALAEKDTRRVKQYARLGRYIGMIFQLTDDCMDFEETEQTAQKPVQSDYEQNVITLPLIHAFQKMEQFKNKAKEEKLERREINEAVKTAGGLDYTRFIAKRYYKKSIDLLKALELVEEKENGLKEILDKAFRLV